MISGWRVLTLFCNHRLWLKHAFVDAKMPNTYVRIYAIMVNEIWKHQECLKLLIKQPEENILVWHGHTPVSTCERIYTSVLACIRNTSINCNISNTFVDIWCPILNR